MCKRFVAETSCTDPIPSYHSRMCSDEVQENVLLQLCVSIVFLFQYNYFHVSIQSVWRQ